MALAAYGSGRKLAPIMDEVTGKFEIRIRAAKREDAATIAALVNKLNVLHGKPEDCDAAAILRDGFDAPQGFSVLLAERQGHTLGYALYHPFYNTDIPGWGIWLADLFVEEAERGLGVGRRLLASVAAEAVADGRISVSWGVMSENHKARDFYAAIGARDEGARILELDGAALADLAGEVAS